MSLDPFKLPQRQLAQLRREKLAALEIAKSRLQKGRLNNIGFIESMMHGQHIKEHREMLDQIYAAEQQIRAERNVIPVVVGEG